MNHKSIVQHEGDRVYRIRSYQSGQLDRRVFTPLSSGDHSNGLNGYCLDAVDEVPAGGMRSAWTTSMHDHPINAGHQQHITRGVLMAELREIDEVAQQIISWILTEVTTTTKP